MKGSSECERVVLNDVGEHSEHSNENSNHS